MDQLFALWCGWITRPFWAAPRLAGSAMHWAGGLRAERRMQTIKVLEPGFPRDDPPPEAPRKPAPPSPVDVPAPSPHDVPPPEPHDVPPPEPGKIPEPARPPEQPPKQSTSQRSQAAD